MLTIRDKCWHMVVTFSIFVWGGFLTGCASNEPTKPFSPADAQRIVTLCSGGMSHSLVAKLAVSYQKNIDAKIEAAATYGARGIILDDSTLTGLNGAERLQMVDKYESCMKEMESRR